MTHRIRWALWLRWSWRDLRQRWIQVLAIALIVALGTGIYSGLISTSAWRLQSNDASYALLRMYDLRLTLTTGSFLEEADLLNAVRQVDHAAWITHVEPRLIVPTLVDASTPEQTIIVPGRLIGAGTAGSPMSVNDLYITAGRAPEAGEPAAVLESKFAGRYNLPAQGQIRLGGDKLLRYVGLGLSPEYFVVFTEEGGMMAEANFAAVFVPLEAAQVLGERPGMVNDLLLRLAADADPQIVRGELERAVNGLASVGVSITDRADDPAYHMLYQDIQQDETFWRWMAYLFMAGAVFGAFNLASRLIESQRREIGIQMALGIPPRLIAIRPLLVAVQIAVLGAAFGIGIGLLLGRAFGDIILTLLPLPIFVTPFQGRVFAEAAGLGAALPIVATLYPVWRAVRVEPVDAIKTGHLVAKGGGLAPLLANRALTGRVLTQMPVRNLLRAPRRAFLTLLGIAAAITLLILIMGILDSFDGTLDMARRELLQDHPDRITVQLNFFYPVDSPVVRHIRALPVLGAAEPVLELGGYLIHEGKTVETLIELVDMQSALWRPSATQAAAAGKLPAILLSANAADSLGVRPGDTITLRHPKRTGLFAYTWNESEVTVSGIHPLPLRFQAYMGIGEAGLMGLDGQANALQIIPAQGVTQDQVKQALFTQPGVASVQPVNAVIRVFEDLIGEFTDMFGVMQIAAVALALLIAYNTTHISLDERAREMATLFAFGVRIRTVLRVSVVENLITSLLGTVVGCGMGFVIALLMMSQVFAVVIPEIRIAVSISPPTLVVALVIGVLVAVVTPMLNVRNLIRMNIPATLRVME